MFVRDFLGMMAATAVVLWGGLARADETPSGCYQAMLEDLPLDEGQTIDFQPLDEAVSIFDARRLRLAEFLPPYAVLDSPGEVFVTRNDRPDGRGRISDMLLTVGTPKGQDVRGTLFIPNADLTGLVKARFTIPADTLKDDLKPLKKARMDYYERLAALDLPGGAWFRYQHRLAAREHLGIAEGAETPLPPQARTVNPTDDMEQSLAFMNGGRALSENMQLDRMLPTGDAAQASQLPSVAIDSIEGITIRQIDWKPLIQGMNPKKDPAARLIPADQHALFFPSFTAMVETIDQADRLGTPVLRLVSPYSEDAQTRQRYQRQLCLSLDKIERLLGPKLVKSVAVTGSDPYFRTGTDVAILLQPAVVEPVEALVKARHAVAVEQEKAKLETGEIDSIPYQAVQTDDRSICSYLAVVDSFVVVTNSPEQLRLIIQTSRGKTPAMADLDEYTFFRDRYPLGDQQQTGLLVVTDDALRRWCGARWRIGSSRRVRATAVLADLQARHAAAIVENSVELGAIYTPYAVPEMGEIRLAADGTRSATYGTLEFNTPIRELKFDKVTEQEAQAYRSFRDSYQRRWRQFYDPIAVSFSVSDDRLAIDTTVMPLVMDSQYREWIRLTAGERFGATAGDPHPEVLLQFIMSLDPDSELFSMANSFASSFAPDKQKPFNWLGKSATIYVDADPIWQEAAGAEDSREFMTKNLFKMPVAVRVETESRMKGTLFLAALRAWLDQTSPGSLVWGNQTYRDVGYVSVRSKTLPENDPMIYYLLDDSALTISLSEAVIQRLIDRNLKRAEPQKPEEKADEQPHPPWLGENMALRIRGEGLKIMNLLNNTDDQTRMQARSWAALPILNQWKRLFPAQDPVEVHLRLWKVKLVCPGGGEYVWNEEAQTMESTVYGHPGGPKTGATLLDRFGLIEWLDFGVTFEEDGLRAKALLQR